MPISEAYNVDCLEYMKSLPDKFFDLAIADPPYWAPEEQTGRIRTTGDVQSSLELGAKPSDLFFKELQRVSRSQIIWGANNFGIPFKGFIVWDKTNIPDEFTLSKCEIASVSENLSRVAKVFRAPSTVTGLKRIHPTQKPISLYAWILKTYATPPQRIFDPMLGSQSSRIAAYKLGFDFYGCELDPLFFRKGDERFRAECLGTVVLPGGRTVIQPSLFD